MRVGNGNGVLSAYMKTKLQAPEEAGNRNQVSTSGKSSDVVDLSPAVKEIDQAKEMAQTIPNERIGKVNEIKNEIETSRYQIKPEEIADKMIKHAIDILA
jgi:flagellar biosynthesis anti-sigma factor FlgM